MIFKENRPKKEIQVNFLEKIQFEKKQKKQIELEFLVLVGILFYI